MKINDNLNRILKGKSMNVHQLSRGAGVAHENLYKILKAKNKNPGVYTVKKIADYLGLTIDELLK
ncbi:XRE family transcriptional regulator [Romboutsia ilealis]|uniref:Helix-turn-helix transcriptional regulator n=1 Tax=Romboutsia faecis TaxID=2764597 RepID=A0ABR7JN42_9FIRM|nr:helix-turn-helix transcriptional regulator [Romboutsia faecis]MBC5996354.1 helix-turn-helix transcriptional regulator [Romboutsia faecis]MRN25005.1 XRE family transcriptional regulator [Romboutsia ilealis]